MIGLVKTKALSLFDRTRLLLRMVYDESPWSLLAISMIVPLSLLALWVWNMTPNVPPLSHGMRPHDMKDLTWFVVYLTGWMLMIAAMMLPSAMPLLMALDRVARGQHHRQQILLVATLAYFGVWGLVGIVLWIANVTAEMLMSHNLRADLNAELTGTGLVLAGLYGLSPFANSCLRACQRPFGFLARHWRKSRNARRQAAIIGTAYGLHCVGCCVPMIALMVVVGMCNMAIIIAMGVAMFIMKRRNSKTSVSVSIALILIITGVLIGMRWIPVSLHFH